MNHNNSKLITLLNATTITATSGKIFIGDCKRVGILLRRGAHTSGSSAFAVNASMDASDNTNPTMSALNTLVDNVTNTNAQGITRVNGKTLAANGDAFLWLDDMTKVNWISITATITTDGNASAFLLIEQ